jgi:hypothetical protein
MKTLSSSQDFSSTENPLPELHFARMLGDRLVAGLIDCGRELPDVTLEEAKRLLAREWRKALSQADSR